MNKKELEDIRHTQMDTINRLREQVRAHEDTISKYQSLSEAGDRDRAALERDVRRHEAQTMEYRSKYNEAVSMFADLLDELFHKWNEQ